MMDKQTLTKGFKTIKYVEEKMLVMFEGDDRNPYFEAVYMALFHCYNQTCANDGPSRSGHTHKMIIQVLEKCLKV